jgi:lipoate-protein ligase A
VLDRIAHSLHDAGQPVDVQGLGDLTLGDRKVSGSAQRRLRRYFLVHLSLLYRFPVALVGRYLKNPRRQPDYRAGRSHADFLTNLDLSREVLLGAIQSAWLPLVPTSGLPSELVDELVATRFGDPAWINRL